MNELIDNLARTLAAPTSRRRMLQAVVGVLVGSVFTRSLVAACSASGCRCTGTGQGSCGSGLVCLPCAGGGSSCGLAAQTCCRTATNDDQDNARLCGANTCCCTRTNQCDSSTGGNGGNCVQAC